MVRDDAAHRSIPLLTSAQVKEVDQMTSQRFGIPLPWLMEAAGWQLARHCRAQTCTDPERLTGPSLEEAMALRRVGVTLDPEPRLEGAELVLDALLGTGLSGPPDGKTAEWIEIINDSDRPVVAVDLPSGLDADTGAIPGVCVKASVTVSLCLPKPALLTEQGARQAGEVWIVDIGIPNEVYAAVGIDTPGHLFAGEDRLRLASLLS